MDTNTLCEAAHAGKYTTVKQALDAGANPNVADGQMHTPLMLAAYNGHADIVKALLAAGADVDRTDPVGRTALMFASSGPFPDAVRALLAHGANVNLSDRGEGWTPLMWAAAEGNLEVVKILLESGADKERKDADKDTAYSFAVRKGHSEVVRLLKESV
ncbi:MAG: ankyrin repeat domain-containing protein [Candidatus Pacebacteria bacterium]|nr:ankyrin repeat domain-containing protein [Candidatus Paceibacterota bacterium]